MKKINIFDIHYDDDFRDKFHKGVDQILSEAHLSNYSMTREFEKKFSLFQESEFSIATSSGTSALELSLLAINVKNKYVFVQTNTFIATGMAILKAGGIPILIDSAPPYYHMCSKQLTKGLEKVPQKNVGAIIPVHIGGHISDEFKKIVEIARSLNVPVIEDCAQSHGASLDDIKCGNWGKMGCFSFYTTKIMSTGEGGMVTTNCSRTYEKLTSLRQFGKAKENSLIHSSEGINAKMSEFQSLMGLLELDRVQSRIEKRREIAKLYQEKLNKNLYTTLKDTKSSYSTYYKQVVISLKHSREKIENALKKNNIMLTGGVYFYPLHRQPVMKEFSYRNFPQADYFASHHFCPPCYPEIELKDIEQICEVLNAVK